MKKRLILSALGLGLLASVNAQDTSDFNKLSVDVGLGVNKTFGPHTSGYATSTPNIGGANLGLRYMFNNKFGIKADGSYENFKDGDDSRNFRTDLLRASLQGVMNLGTILNTSSLSPKFGILAHAGAGVSVIATQEPVNRGFGEGGDYVLNAIAGLTPQYKITDKIALFADVSAIAHTHQGNAFDGASRTSNKFGVSGLYVTASAGLNIYLGKNEKHADWMFDGDDTNDKLDAIESKIAGIEDKLKDSDNDGVADYLDKESNTQTGVATNSKGIALDKNSNKIPDELETALDARYSSKNEVPTGATMIENGGDIIEQLINGGYVNVYFNFGSAKPQTYSFEAINYLAQYMKENSTVKADLIGYADEIGNTGANNRLSERRAKKVYDILVASGIDGNRLSTEGRGEDASVDKKSEAARQLVRRVTFKLKK